MARMGKKPITIPDKVNASLVGSFIAVEGPLGKLKEEIPPTLKIEITDDKRILITQIEKTKSANSHQGLIHRLITNMVQGVTRSFEKQLEIQGVGFRSQVKEKILELQLGFSHPVEYRVAEEIDVEVVKGTRIIIKGFNKQLVGQTAAEIRSFYPVEPYKGKGIRYVDEQVRRKAGKSAVGTGASGGGK